MRCVDLIDAADSTLEQDVRLTLGRHDKDPWPLLRDRRVESGVGMRRILKQRFEDHSVADWVEDEELL